MGLLLRSARLYRLSHCHMQRAVLVPNILLIIVDNALSLYAKHATSQNLYQTSIYLPIYLLNHFLPLPPPLPPTPHLPLISIQQPTPKHHRRPRQNARRQPIPKQPNTQKQTDQFADIQHDRDGQRGGLGGQEIDAADAG